MTSTNPLANEFLIRQATQDDAETIHAAILQMGRDIGGGALKITSTPDDLRRHGLAPGGAFEGLVAEIGGEFAGMCLYLPMFSTWLGKPGVYVQDLFVDRRFRGSKIGERLIRHVASVARDKGAAYLRLAVDADNAAAQAFYERLGITHYSADQIHAAYGEAFLALADADADGRRTRAEES